MLPGVVEILGEFPSAWGVYVMCACVHSFLPNNYFFDIVILLTVNSVL